MKKPSKQIKRMFRAYSKDPGVRHKSLKAYARWIAKDTSNNDAHGDPIAQAWLQNKR